MSPIGYFLEAFGYFLRFNLVLELTIESTKATFYVIGQSFVVVNGQMLSKTSGNLVTLLTVTPRKRTIGE